MALVKDEEVVLMAVFMWKELDVLIVLRALYYIIISIVSKIELGVEPVVLQIMQQHVNMGIDGMDTVVFLYVVQVWFTSKKIMWNMQISTLQCYSNCYC